MKSSVQVTGLDQLRQQFDQFSDRRFDAACATGLTRAAKAGAGMLQAQIDDRVDRPTARTKSATAFKSATAQSLMAEVFVKDRGGGTPAASYLEAEFFGGSRRIKLFERALVSAGVMPSGYVTVPGKGAKLDGYGNVSRAQIVAVLTALGSQELSPGYQRVISKSTSKRMATMEKRGLAFIVVRPEERRIARTDPGIYIRTEDGFRKAVFIFRQSTKYKPLLSLEGQLAVDIQRRAVDEIELAMRESSSRLAARGGL